MTENPNDPDSLARACALAMYDRDAAARSLGIAIDDVREGYARLSMRIRETMLNGYAITHGGFVFTLADTAFAYACNSRDEATVALQCSISFLAPSREGDTLIAIACERSGAGRRTGLFDVSVMREETEIASFRGVSYRIEGTVIHGSRRERS